MSRRRRAALLMGLALVLGGLAASDVARREGAIARQLGPAVPVVAARADLPAGARLAADQLTVRRIPARYAPSGAISSPGELVGSRLAVAVPAGSYLLSAAIGTGSGPTGPQLRPGERIAEIVAAGAPDLLQPGGRADLLVTRESSRGGPGETELALEDVEVLSASPAEAAGSGDPGAGGARVRAALRVTVRQAVYLAAAQSFARELRLLPRGPEDRRHGAAGLTVDSSLR